jgi:hypothetical protein
MSGAVKTLTQTPSSGRRRLAIAAVVCLAGLLLVVLLAPSRKPPATRTSRASTPVPERRDAAEAALLFAHELAVTGVEHPSVYGRRLRTIAAPGAESRVREAFGTGAREGRKMIGESGVLRAVPIGYRVDSLDTHKAEVSVWTVALAGGTHLNPTAQWRVLTLELTWTSSGWRVADGSGASGPSPESPLALLAAEASTFEELRHVP